MPFLDSYREKFEAVEGICESTGVILQMVLACLILYKLTKSISNIVQGLMSGSPSLGGSMMTDQLKSAGSTAAGAALAATGNVAGARAAAGGFAKKGFLANIAKSAAINGTPLGSMSRKYQAGVKNAQTNATRSIVDLFRVKPK